MHIHVRASKAHKPSTSGVSAPRHRPLHAATLSYPAEFADIASEYSIGFELRSFRLELWPARSLLAYSTMVVLLK
jgi:hypothetical protein